METQMSVSTAEKGMTVIFACIVAYFVVTYLIKYMPRSFPWFTITTSSVILIFIAGVCYAKGSGS